jgi:hypothetical protein
MRQEKDEVLLQNASAFFDLRMVLQNGNEKKQEKIIRPSTERIRVLRYHPWVICIFLAGLLKSVKKGD